MDRRTFLSSLLGLAATPLVKLGALTSSKLTSLLKKATYGPAYSVYSHPIPDAEYFLAIKAVIRQLNHCQKCGYGWGTYGSSVISWAEVDANDIDPKDIKDSMLYDIKKRRAIKCAQEFFKNKIIGCRNCSGEMIYG